MINKLVTSFIFLFYLLHAFSQSITQEVNSSGGDYYVQLGSSIQFNIGEVIIEDYQNSNCHLQQGFEQGYFGILNVSESNISQFITVYPNPTKNKVKVWAQFNELIKLELLDFSGKNISFFTFTNELEIDLSEYSSGVYFLRIYNVDQTNFQNIKLIKYE